MELTATAPCPTADATRLTTPWLTSPAAEMPDTLASIKNESCVSFQFFGWRPSRIKRRNKLKSQIGFGYFNQGYRKIERHFGSNRTHGISVTSCYALIWGGIKKGSLFALNTTPFCILTEPLYIAPTRFWTRLLLPDG
jgi:hypothetical protein